MSTSVPIIDPSLVAEAAAQLREAAAAKKCRGCGCLHSTLAAVEQAIPLAARSAELAAAMDGARQHLTPTRYDCLGCEVCHPALAINALNRAGYAVEPASCPTERVPERQGWPPLPGAYQVLRYQAPVAVCTLTDEHLRDSLARQAGPSVAIVGTLQTENLGIERLVQNVLANPHLRFLVVCGEDSRRQIGHLPGQSLVALARAGVDEHSRIVGAAGNRPVMRNVTREAVEHFRRTVEVVDLVGVSGPAVILNAVARCGHRPVGPAEPFAAAQAVAPLRGYVPERMVPDPAGYFVLYVDPARRQLALEHFSNAGVLDAIIEGSTAAELYVAAIDRQLVSRLDHAAYLGRELARAEHALATGEPYVQDAAPELESAPRGQPGGCGPHCPEVKTP